MDRELVVRAQKGDHDAFASLATLAIGRLTAIARLILHDEDRAQDAVQDTLVAAWRGLRSLRDPDHFEAWMHRLLVRSCRARVRRDWRRDVREVRMTGEEPIAIAGGQTTVDNRDQLERCLRRLTADQRAVLVTTYYADLSLADAAAVLEIPIGTMKSRLNRALEALRAQIDADDRAAVAGQEQFA